MKSLFDSSVTYTVHADGGSRGNPGPAAYGATIATANGVIRELAGGLGVATNNVAEYTGVLVALRTLAHMQKGDPEAHVLVRLDSRLVVEQMSGRWKIKHPDMRTLATQVRSSYPPAMISYQWIPRAENTHADRLVNEVLDQGGDATFRIDRSFT